MRIVLIGTVLFSEKALNKLIDIGANIVGVGTKKQSKFNNDFADLAPLSEKNNIPYRYINDINSVESINWIRSLAPDIIFCFGWSSLIGKELLQLPDLGVIGFHPAKLPENRGRHPIIWAIALGLKKSASTFFIMQEGADNGDILSQVDFDILDEDDAQSIYNKVINIALEQIEIFIPRLEKFEFDRVQQNQDLASSWRKREKRDGLIDFRMTSAAIHNLIRALTAPYIGAHLEYQGKEIIVWKAEVALCSINNIEPGKVLEIYGNMIVVKTYDSAIKLIEHEFTRLPICGDYL